MNRIRFKIVECFYLRVSAVIAKIFNGDGPKRLVFHDGMRYRLNGFVFAKAVPSYRFHRFGVVDISVVQINVCANAVYFSGMTVLPDAVGVFEVGLCYTRMSHPHGIAF